MPNFITQTAQRIYKGFTLMTPGQIALAAPLGQPNYGAFRSVFKTPPASVPLPAGTPSLFAVNHAPVQP